MHKRKPQKPDVSWPKPSMVCGIGAGIVKSLIIREHTQTTKNNNSDRILLISDSRTTNLASCNQVTNYGGGDLDMEIDNRRQQRMTEGGGWSHEPPLAACTVRRLKVRFNCKKFQRDLRSPSVVAPSLFLRRMSVRAAKEARGKWTAALCGIGFAPMQKCWRCEPWLDSWARARLAKDYVRDLGRCVC
ncbi:pectin lyase-like superfamily protein [Striga asiatica]|uniref:Pectin lyase-like superfamily protein n=1 Tax=Striga asiatica TaxID=4170 RepID=A0A5A7QVZ3_STRAF|nr:pectin lyase-like superfamily protein [Striga asiatica]